MSIQRFVTLQKQQNQEQPAGKLQLLSKVLCPSLITGSAMSNIGYDAETVHNPAMLETIPGYDLPLYVENLQQQDVLSQYNNFEAEMNVYQHCNTEVETANSYLPSPCISSPSSMVEDINSGGMVSTWSVHDANSIGSTFQAQQQVEQYHHHPHQAANSASVLTPSLSTSSWSTPLSPMSNSSITVCTNWEIPVSMWCSLPTNIKYDCTSTTTKVVGYEWKSENNPHYMAITTEVDIEREDHQNPQLGPFLVARRYVPTASYRIDEMSIDLNDQIMVHRVIEDGWCIGERCSAPTICGFFPVGCLLIESIAQIANTHPDFASIWRRFSDCTAKWPDRVQSLFCLACKGDVFPKRKHLNRHLRTCTKHSACQRQCEICGKWLSRRDSFVRHQRNVHHHDTSR